ncbi:anti-sigma factor family protein [Treponema primitia]|uniref:anti-sigma factor family protein n=1 Tax=Treponema primitia TaxID=88058 RepID=UPI0002554FED|nr:zf-HC2 domain-containing protein [Treponema primitia]
MCPDPQILSLYYDGELPSPWKEKLEAHLRDCSHCTSRLEQFRQLSGTLEEERFSAAALTERVWQRLSNPDAAIRERPVQIWGRSVSVPLPLLAATAAALILAFGFFFLRSTPDTAPADSTLASLDMQTIMPISDLNGVLQYLGDDSSDIVIIRLPESRNFMSSGEPAMIRAADYSGRKSEGSR